MPAFLLQIQFIARTAYESKFGYATREAHAIIFVGPKVGTFWDHGGVIGKPRVIQALLRENFVDKPIRGAQLAKAG